MVMVLSMQLFRVITEKFYRKSQLNFPISTKRVESSVRFARLRKEKRHNYLRKVAELTNSNFITNDHPNVAGIVMAGNADFKK
jgi:hypothetical protein